MSATRPVSVSCQYPVFVAGCAIAVFAAATAAAGDAIPRRCVVIDVFASERDVAAQAAIQGVERFAAERGGIVVVRRFLDASVDDRADLAKLAARHGFDLAETPVFATCGTAMRGVRDPAVVVAWLGVALQIEVFTRAGCSRCDRAKVWIATVAERYPGLTVSICDLTRDSGARAILAELVRRNRVAAASVPVFHVGGRLEVGFDRAETTGRRLEALLDHWTCPCPARVDGTDDQDAPLKVSEAIDLPVLGRVAPATLGLPLFTIAVGLVDGFNPCAMWVLMLLLAVLVNLRDRWRMLAIAATFVLVSGAVYFAFMAAWLNVFEWIGYLRPVQVGLGLVAVTIGLVHLKDFFAFGTGPSLSIAAAAKPGIYERIRRIVTAENLPAALAAAFTLAVIVNIVELLCTAGLPALYTNVLAQHHTGAAARYGFLGLYIAAYMFDDAIMVGMAVATLSRFKLQETGGRWLKLVSGVVVIALGLVMLLRPEWLS
jgi:hypothetical protein